VSPDNLASEGQANWVLDLDYADYGAPDNKIQGDYLTFDMLFGLRQQ
jgi:hypothetical protein